MRIRRVKFRFGMRRLPIAGARVACITAGESLPRRAIRHRSGEVYVVSEAGLAGTIQQSQQSHALVTTGSAPDDNNDAMMWPRLCKMRKVIAIASQENATSPVGKAKNGLIGRIAREGLTQECDIVAQLRQQIAQVVGDVVIEQELHSGAGANCLATSKSISPRWSS